MYDLGRLEDRPSLATPALEKGVILFVGSTRNFSTWIMRAAAFESGDLDLHRCDSPSTGEIERFARSGALRVVVLDEGFADDVERQIDHLPVGADWVIAYRDPQRARRLMNLQGQEGAVQLGFLPMNVPIDVWTSMFRLVLCGHFCVPYELLVPGLDARRDAMGANLPAGIAAGIGSDLPPCADVELTPREEEVLELVASGCRNKVVGHELGVTEHTVKLHMHHIMRKIGVRNRTEAARWFLSRTGVGQA